MCSVKISPTSPATAQCDPIILRETKTTRLVFLPQLVDNINDASECVNGTFIFQKKGPNKEWIESRELDLSNLRAEEWVRLHLHAEEIYKLTEYLNSLHQAYNKVGIPKRATQLFSVEQIRNELQRATTTQLLDALSVKKNMNRQVLARLLRIVVQVADREGAVTALEDIGIEGLKTLNALVGLQQLKAALEVWESNKVNSNEGFCCQKLREYSYILSQVFSFPIVILTGQAYMGGKSVRYTGANLVDFLLTNKLTKNAALVEIKTPTAELLGTEYRDGIYKISSDLIGGVMQVIDYKDSLLKEYNNIRANSEEGDEFEAFDPCCLLVIGNQAAENLNRSQRKSFELYRNGLKDVQVITFDELFSKVQLLVDLLEGTTPPS